MIIEMDDRENAEMLGILEELGITPLVTRLDLADYKFRDVIVERKSIDDFCGSIMDGRIRSQAERLKEWKGKKFILISGKIGERKSEIGENAILGMIVSLVVKYEIPVICVDNDKQLGYVMKRIFERVVVSDAENMVSDVLEKNKDCGNKIHKCKECKRENDISNGTKEYLCPCGLWNIVHKRQEVVL